MPYTDNIIDQLTAQGLVRIPTYGDVPLAESAATQHNLCLLALDHETIIKIAHLYGCFKYQAVKVINAQQSHAALHDLLVEMANQERARRS